MDGTDESANGNRWEMWGGSPFFSAETAFILRSEYGGTYINRMTFR